MKLNMENLLDLEKFPLDAPDCTEYSNLVERCRDDLEIHGMFNLEGFVHSGCLKDAIAELVPKMASESFQHERMHNIYFKKEVEGLSSNHPAMVEVKTSNRTLCADQLLGNPAVSIYEWQPLIDFIALVMGKAELHTMNDALARVNVMAYKEGETLNWHFDRSEFTTTLLLQAPQSGGEFEYRTNLRSEKDPNYEGVAQLLLGSDPLKCSINPTPGTLNVFRGINTPHRVTKIEGKKERIIAVYSYYDNPGVKFSAEEQIGFYGRAL
jgi:hypothetical protein